METNLTRWLKENGNPNPRKWVLPPKEELVAYYSENTATTRTIGKLYDVDQKVVCKWLKHYEIPPKKRIDFTMPKPPLNNGHWGWRGNKVSYSALHKYIRYHLGAPNECKHCGSTTAKKFEWANISKEYKRDFDDWIRLCTKCHRRFDKKGIV